MTNIATLTWFAIGACVVYLVSQDSNVYEWLVLQSKLASLWLQRQWYKVLYNPDSPWVRYKIKRNADRLAKEILKENENR